jgi:hypothetical protein
MTMPPDSAKQEKKRRHTKFNMLRNEPTHQEKRCQLRKKEKRSPHYHHRESCPPMSIDDPTDSPPTSEEEDETKEEHILKKVAIAKAKAREQAAHDTRDK